MKNKETIREKWMKTDLAKMFAPFEEAVPDFFLALRDEELKEIAEEVGHKAHFSKLAGSRYDGYINVKDVLSIITNKMK